MPGKMKKKPQPAMSYAQAQKVIMNRGGAPKALIASLKKKYPEEFGYGGGTRKPVMKKGGKTARKRKK